MSSFEECFDLDSLLNEDNDEELSERECQDEPVGNHNIRSQDDGRNFEPDDYFPLPLEVEMKCSPKVSRKRKQKLNELTDIEELSSEEDDPDPDYQVTNYRRRSGRLPLYLLNPEDFPDDPQKQMQIRRARTTYRHHQKIKEQIVKLTEENQLLREHVNQLKSKVAELGRCGCQQNATADLSVLDTVIPVVPQGMYVQRSSKRVVAKLSAISKSEPKTVKHARKTMDVTSSMSNAVDSSTVTIAPIFITCNDPPQTAKPTVTVDMSKPLINITASRLASFKSNTLSSANVVTPKLSKPLINWVLNNGTQGIKSTGATTVPVPLSAVVKNEITETSTPTRTTLVKSRIVFAKKGSSSALKTASQLYLRTKGVAPKDSSITDCLPPQL